MTGKGSVATGFSKLAANNVLKVVGRVGMALAVPFIGWVIAFEVSQSTAIASVSTKVDDKVSVLSSSVEEVAKSVDAVAGRTTVLETRINIGQKSREDFQDQMLAAVSKLADQQLTILQQNAAIIARLDASDKRLERLESKP